MSDFVNKTAREFWQIAPRLAAISKNARPGMLHMAQVLFQKPDLSAAMTGALLQHQQSITRQLHLLPTVDKTMVFTSKIAHDLIAISYVVDDGARAVSIYTAAEAEQELYLFGVEGKEIVRCEY